jgi:glyoxylase-like metal-dependent hydrolase (beta-lactamase superfamily II)
MRFIRSGTLGAVLVVAACQPDQQPVPEPAPELRETSAAYCESLPRPQYAALEPVPVSNDWFEVYRVAPDVYALYEPFQFQEVISYLILGDESALLFDTGMGISRISDVVGELTELPVTVLNSHTHMDHVGGNAEFDRILAMDNDFTRSRAQGRSNEQVRGEVGSNALCRPLPEGVTEDSYRTRAFEITESIGDGHEIDLGGTRLEVLAVPGHTPDAIALLDREAGHLWTGDSFYEGPIWLFAPETDLDAYESSMGRLAALAPELTTLFPAHNTPVASPDRLVQLAGAIARVGAGTADGRTLGDGEMEYEFDGFSLLMRIEDPEAP